METFERLLPHTFEAAVAVVADASLLVPLLTGYEGKRRGGMCACVRGAQPNCMQKRRAEKSDPTASHSCAAPIIIIINIVVIILLIISINGGDLYDHSNAAVSIKRYIP